MFLILFYLFLFYLFYFILFIFTLNRGTFYIWCVLIVFIIRSLCQFHVVFLNKIYNKSICIFLNKICYKIWYIYIIIKKQCIPYLENISDTIFSHQKIYCRKYIYLFLNYDHVYHFFKCKFLKYNYINLNIILSITDFANLTIYFLIVNVNFFIVVLIRIKFKKWEINDN